MQQQQRSSLKKRPLQEETFKTAEKPETELAGQPAPKLRKIFQDFVGVPVIETKHEQEQQVEVSRRSVLLLITIVIITITISYA